MASGGGSQVLSPPPNSSGYLLKCAKEKEKLRSKLSRNLQADLLSVFQESLFVDLLIPCSSGEQVGAHSALLQVRVPAFHQHLLKDTPTTQAQTSLTKGQLTDFLKTVYTDDDIRKHECNILRLQNYTLDEEATNVEDDSLEHCNVEDVELSLDAPLPTEAPSHTEEVAIANGCEISSQSPVALDAIKFEEEEEMKQQPNSIMDEHTQNNKSDIAPHPVKDVHNLTHVIEKPVPRHLDILPIERGESSNDYDDAVLLSPAASDIDIKTDDTASPVSTSSLVRSSTFDLQGPLALEKVLDSEEGEDSQPFDAMHIGQDYREIMMNTTKEIQQCLAAEQGHSMKSFYLHQHQSQSQLPQHHGDEISMSDSGFLSQSLFSDNDLTSSIASSLVTSFDASQLVSPGFSRESEPNAEKEQLSPNQPSPMFPMYIDVQAWSGTNSGALPGPTKAVDPNGNVSSYCEPEVGKKPAESSSASQKALDLIAEIPVDCPVKSPSASSSVSALKRPQSCYMFIDFDKVKQEDRQNVMEMKSRTTRERGHYQRLPSLSMFIDINQEMSDSVTTAQEQYKKFQTGSKIDKKSENASTDIPDLLQDKVERVINVAPLQAEPSSAKANPPTTSKTEEIPKAMSKTEEIPKAMSKTEEIPKAMSKSEEIPKSMSKTEEIPKSMSKTEDIPKAVSKPEEIPKATSKPEEIPKTTTTGKQDEVRNSPRKSKDAKSGVDEEGLLPMSPIMRRKTVKPEVVRPVSEPVVHIKASTKPQDIDAMTFRRSLTDADDSILEVTVSKICILQRNESDLNTIQTLPPPVQDSEVHTVVKETEFQPVNETESSGDVQTDSQPVETSAQSASIDKPRPKMQQALSFENEDDSETVYSEVSDVSSSMLGSSSKHPRDNSQSPEGEDASAGSNTVRALEACSKLGQDLLRMFLEEICSDVSIQVNDKIIKAHRCILVSRCSYFAAMLKGEWSENMENVINLQGFSYPVVHFALCHLYSGALNLPKDIAIPELALLADMLALDSLKEVIVFYLKMNYCHFFHKPCNHCSVGAVECLPIAVSCSLTELQGKVVRWVGKHFTRIWATKAFASLQDDLREQCYQQTLLNLSVDTVIDMTLSCDRLMATLPHIKWAEPVFGLVTRLLEDCIHFMASKFDQVLASDGFMALGKSQSWNVAALEDSVLSSVELVNPDSACRTFVQLGRLIPMTESQCSRDMGDWTQNFLDLLHRIQRHCERYLIHNANRVVHCQSWALLAPEVQKKIKDAAVIVFEFEKPTAPPPRLSSLQRKPKHPEDKSLTFPRKAQVVRGKKTSKSFRERSVEKGEVTEVKRPLSENLGCKMVEKELPTEKTNGCEQPADDADEKSNSCKDSLELEDEVESMEEESEESSHKLTYVIRGEDKRPLVLAPLPGAPSHGSALSPRTPLPPCPPHSPKVATPSPKASNNKTEELPPPTPPRSPAQRTKVKNAKVHNLNNLQPASNAPEKPPRKSSAVNHCTSPTCPTKVSTNNNNKTYTVKGDDMSPSYEAVWVSMKEPLPVDEDDLVAEIDEETMLVNNCLQEAEILEQELAKKLQRQNQPTYAAVQPRKKEPSKTATDSKMASSIPSGLPQHIRKKSELKESKSRKSSSSKSSDPSPSKLKVESTEGKSRATGAAVSPRLRVSSSGVRERTKTPTSANRK